MDLCNRSVIKSLMDAAGIGFRKDLGQNFLVSPEIPRRLAEECREDPNCLMLEIGPGIGCLTTHLADRFTHVVAIEIDKRLPPILEQTLAEHDNVTVVCADVLRTDVPALLAETKERLGLPADYPVAVCANLPYYITTPILMYLIESGVPFSSITVMVQSEVADRLVAGAGSAEYGAITAVLGYYGTCRRLFTVPAGCFVPQPKVHSAVVRLDLYPTSPYDVENEKLLFSVIKGAFEQRRKILLNALSSALSMSKESLTAAIEQAGLSPQIRGEKLSVEQFVTLSNILATVR